MAEQMTHRERVQAALAGRPVDRPPVSMWRHFFDREMTAQGMAEAMLAFQREHDWDFMKVNPRAFYHVEDWGVRLRYTGHPHQAPEVTGRPVKNPQDWERLQALDIHAGVLGEHLAALRSIARDLKGQVPFLMTVFTPLSIASRLAASEETFLQHLRGYPQQVQHALEIVTDTFARFSRACLEAGASGLFYATTAWATRDRLTEEEYARWARPYDLKLLRALPPAEFHLLHVCRDNNMLAALTDYPVAAFNWDARGRGNPSLREGKALLSSKAVIGGVSHRTLLAEGTPAQVAGEVASLRREMGATGWMLGPGCTFPPQTPEANVRAVRDALRSR
ncbi:MAG: uroporphyrinogen decarboxylase [Chloroflexi bacterium]|nr:uroporphyrinogen decarboxylase [Chloroflexota bacterium]